MNSVLLFNRVKSMSAAKKQKSSTASKLHRMFSWLIGPGRGALILVAVVGLFGGGWFFTQRWLWPKIADSPEYRLTVEQVEITPPPPWIHTDIRGEVLRSPALDGPLSIMDDTLTKRIATAFAAHPWVAKVQKVSKSYSAVKVELAYRKPVCMVAVPNNGLLPAGLLPVDADAVLLPTGENAENFTAQEALRFPCLQGVERWPTCAAGQRWTDARVIGAAEIAAAIGDLWEPMRLHYIVPLRDDPTAPVGGGAAARTTEPFFTITTYGESGTRILWGYAPNAGVLGEPPAAKKVAFLKDYFAKYDTLDGPQGRAKEHDVHRL